MKWESIDTVPTGEPINLRFKHAIGEYDLKEPCLHVCGSFYRMLRPLVSIPHPIAWRPHGH